MQGGWTCANVGWLQLARYDWLQLNAVVFIRVVREQCMQSVSGMYDKARDCKEGCCTRSCKTDLYRTCSLAEQNRWKLSLLQDHHQQGRIDHKQSASKAHRFLHKVQ